MKKQITLFISILFLLSFSKKTTCIKTEISKYTIHIIKLGGSAITEKGKSTGVARYDVIKNICIEIADFLSKNPNHKVILINGAGSFAHPIAKKYNLHLGLTEKNINGFFECHKGVKEINDIIVTTLNEHGVPALPIHPLSCALCSNGKISTLSTKNLKQLIKNRFVPVLHGDIVADSGSGMSILSGDQIVVYLGTKLNAESIGYASIEDGVYDGLGNIVPEINHENFSEIKKYIGESGNVDVTGGMFAKVSELLSPEAPAISYIFNGTTPGNLTKILLGEHIGTKIENKK